jgi:ribosomal protein S18 acetylase RimI-like enzyme
MLSLVDRPSKLRQPKCVNQTQVCIRTATPDDAEALRAFLACLSPNAQYQRFFTGLGSVSPSLVRDLITVSPRQQVVLAMLGSEVVGHGMASASANGAIEFGVVVGDSHRQRGIGNRLIRALIEHAVHTGSERLQFDVLCENQLVLDWIRRGLPDIRFERDGYTLTGFALLHLGLVAAPAA